MEHESSLIHIMRTNHARHPCPPDCGMHFRRFSFDSSEHPRADSLPDTKPLEEKGDLAAIMVQGIGKYLDRELAASVEKRKQFWKPDFSSAEAFAKSVAPNREHLKAMLGMVEQRVKFADIDYVGGPSTPSLVAETNCYTVHAIRWPVVGGISGEGLLLEPKGKAVGQIVAIPDAGTTPEQLVGLAPGVEKESQYARRLAEDGFRVVVPVLIDRRDNFSGNARLNRKTNIPHREFVYRMAYEMGRRLSATRFKRCSRPWIGSRQDHSIAVVGWGERRHAESSSQAASIQGSRRCRQWLLRRARHVAGTDLSQRLGAVDGVRRRRACHAVHAQACGRDRGRTDAAGGPPSPQNGQDEGAGPGELGRSKPVPSGIRPFERRTQQLKVDTSGGWAQDGRRIHPDGAVGFS